MIDSNNVINIVDKTVDVTNLGIIVAGEQNSELVTFKIDRYHDNEDLSLKKVQLIYRNTAGVHPPEDLVISKVTDREIYISWKLSANTCLKAGNTVACLCFLSKDYALKTKNFKFTVEASIDPTTGTAPVDKNWYVVIEGRMDEIEKNCLLKTEIADWAKQPVKPTYTAEEIGAEPVGTADGILRQSLKYTDSMFQDVKTTTTAINEKVSANSKLITDHKVIVDKNVQDTLANTTALQTLNGDGVGSVRKTVNDAIAAENLSQYATDTEMQETNKKVQHIEESYGEVLRMPFNTFPKPGNSKNIYVDSTTNDTYVFDGQKYIRTNTSKFPDIVNNVLIIKA